MITKDKATQNGAKEHICANCMSTLRILFGRYVQPTLFSGKFKRPHLILGLNFNKAKQGPKVKSQSEVPCEASANWKLLTG